MRREKKTAAGRDPLEAQQRKKHFIVNQKAAIKCEASMFESKSIIGWSGINNDLSARGDWEVSA